MVESGIEFAYIHLVQFIPKFYINAQPDLQSKLMQATGKIFGRYLHLKSPDEALAFSSIKGLFQLNNYQPSSDFIYFRFGGFRVSVFSLGLKKIRVPFLGRAPLTKVWEERSGSDTELLCRAQVRGDLGVCSTITIRGNDETQIPNVVVSSIHTTLVTPKPRNPKPLSE